MSTWVKEIVLTAETLQDILLATQGVMLLEVCQAQDPNMGCDPSDRVSNIYLHLLNAIYAVPLLVILDDKSVLTFWFSTRW